MGVFHDVPSQGHGRMPGEAYSYSPADPLVALMRCRSRHHDPKAAQISLCDMNRVSMPKSRDSPASSDKIRKQVTSWLE